MKDICIEMFPARSGDCFLVRLNNGKNIIIDMGYKETYTNYVRRRLIELREQGQCIDLLVITHMDEDHIEGVIEFIKENGQLDNPRIIQVKEVWHNSYRHLQFNKPKIDKIPSEEYEILNQIVSNYTKSINKENKENDPVSAIQGSTLAGYLYKYGYVKSVWNKSFDLNAVNLDYRNKFNLDEANIRLISPNTKKLERLSKFWHSELKRSKLDFKLSNEEIFDDAYEMYIKNLIDDVEYEEFQTIGYSSKAYRSLEDIIGSKIIQTNKDKSKSNGASIAFILEYRNKKILFLGDAHEDIIIEEIKKENIEKVDVIKVSHHGSIKNNYNWTEFIKSDLYLISTNGEKHGHPDSEFIAKLLKSSNHEKTLYFNYKVDIGSELDSEATKEKYNCSVVIGDGYRPVKIEI